MVRGRSRFLSFCLLLFLLGKFLTFLQRLFHLWFLLEGSFLGLRSLLRLRRALELLLGLFLGGELILLIVRHLLYSFRLPVRQSFWTWNGN
ncbi:unknown [Clostridium sp. CAG:1013]|nr:unknown [Clostridium sp. CAG:1013]